MFFRELCSLCRALGENMIGQYWVPHSMNIVHLPNHMPLLWHQNTCLCFPSTEGHMWHLAKLYLSTLLILLLSLIFVYCCYVRKINLFSVVISNWNNNLLFFCCGKWHFISFKIFMPFILFGFLAFTRSPDVTWKSAASLLFTDLTIWWGFTVFFRGGTGCRLPPVPSVPVVTHSVHQNVNKGHPSLLMHINCL